MPVILAIYIVILVLGVWQEAQANKERANVENDA